MSPKGHKGGEPAGPPSDDSLETVVRGEQVLERVKATSRRIRDACRRLLTNDANPEGPTLKRAQDAPPENG